MRFAAQVQNRQRPRSRLRYHLLWPTIGLYEDSAQRLVAADQRSEGTLKRGYVKRSAEIKCGWDNVGCALRLDLVQKPKPLL